MAIDNKDKKVLNVPHLRFPEFTEEWVNVSLKDVADFQKERISSGLLDESTYISTENILQNFQGVQSAISIPANTNVVAYKKNDILLSNIRPYLKKVWFSDRIGGCSADVFVLRSKTCEPEFLYNVIASDKFINYVMSGAKGVKMPRGDKNQMESFSFSIPAVVEQRKISRLFQLLDERIVTQNKIIEDLKKLKSAISLKMLHSDSWEQFKIQDIASIGRGRVISSVEISQQENPLYPVYSSQTSNDGIMGYLDDFMFEGEYISWTTDGANAGTVFYRNGKFNCTNVCGLLKLKKGFDAHFVSLVLAEATRMYVSTNLANPKLMNNTMGNIQIRLPKLEEQKRISVVFRKLHGLLETHNSLIIKYSKQKQYLLSQMFI
ncbi:restriction endonuclease subunit S [Bacteroides uniformis]|uniref:restriction endonuclease subunit S n=1 Tax=Bacteroides uniformis TaxID=820 RepID=UPI000E58B297|nr:restriction endonuclease subunit S [Bacteroides uniformis]RHE38124.1 restriction endonuclease subunit S [Bacteroides uniformis]